MTLLEWTRTGRWTHDLEYVTGDSRAKGQEGRHYAGGHWIARRLPGVRMRAEEWTAVVGDLEMSSTLANCEAWLWDRKVRAELAAPDPVGNPMECDMR
jgi:hypothetical protein